jgi:hypothetical protein
MTCKKIGFLKMFLFHSKLLASFRYFQNLAPISKNALRKDTSKPFVCALQKFEKSGFFKRRFPEMDS